MEIDAILNVALQGFLIGLLFANITILSGWGIRQLIIFFKKIIYGGI